MNEISEQSHACCFFDTEINRNEAIIPFIAAGLQRNEKVICLFEENHASIQLNLSDFLLSPLNSFIDQHQFALLNCLDENNKQENSEKVLAFLKNEVAKALNSGFTKLRFVFDMFWILNEPNVNESLLKYETDLIEFIDTNPCLGICLFNRNIFAPDTLLVALSSHPATIVENEFFANFYYINPSTFFTPDSQEKILSAKLHHLNNYSHVKKQLERSEKRYRLISELTSDYVYEVDVKKDGSISLSFVSDNFNQLTGRNIDEVATIDKWSEIFPPEDFYKISVLLEKMLQTGEKEKIECRSYIKNGDLRWVRVIAQPKYDEHTKQIISIYGTVKDITDRKNAEAEVFESNEQFRATFENSPIGNCLVDISGKFIKTNTAVCNIFGYSSDELTEMNFLDITHQDDLVKSKEFVKNILDGKPVTGIIQKRYIHKDGSLVWGLTSIYLHKSIQNIPLYFIAQIQDISTIKKQEFLLKEKQEELESQNEEFRQLNEDLHNAKSEIENREVKLREAQEIAVIGFYDLDINTGSWESSDVLNTILGIDKDYLKTVDTWGEMVYADDRIFMQKYFQHEILEKKKPFDIEYRIQRVENSEIRWVHGKGVLEFDNNGNIVKMLGTIQDITERKKTEILLREKTEEIEAQNEEYRQLNEDLFQAKQKAEEADKLKSAFLANMSHEIRTPMNGILGFSEMLTGTDISEDKHKQFIQIIQDCSNQLLTLIDDLIDIAKIESNQIKISKSSTNLNELFFDVYSLTKQKADANSLELYLSPGLKDDLCVIQTDSVRLKQIILNLINNALKFTKKGHIKFGYIVKEFQVSDIKSKEIIASANKKECNKYLEIFVEDTGMGISAKDQEIIFERFRQSDNTILKNLGGTGLGLSISKSLVQLLGGEIWCKSELEKGSTFYFTIPCEQKPSDINIGQINLLSGVKQQFPRLITILIAEDELMNYLFFEEIFYKMNVKTIHAENGEKAIGFVKKYPDIDIVLMDMKMPVVNGYDATIEIKKIRKNLPVIAQTAYAQSTDKIKAMEAGCDEYISKPINSTKLISLIKKHIQ